MQGDPECIRLNRWNLEALDRALEMTPSRKVAVQAGGNLGVFASYLSGKFQAVYTFEPDPELFPLMVANAPEPNIIRFQAALGDKPGFVSMDRPPQSHAGEAFVASTGIIPTIMLDDLHLTTCDLLYLDVEGFELFALHGAKETIRRCRPVIALEMNKCCERYSYTHAELHALMGYLGYAEEAHVQADHIFKVAA